MTFPKSLIVSLLTNYPRPWLLLLLLLGSAVQGVECAIRLPKVMSDHIVLQRDQPLPVWGWAEPGERVTVQLLAQSATTQAAADGKWQVILNPLPAGGPHTLTVVGTNTLTLRDVLIGEVWVASGQSNMEWKLGWMSATYPAEIAASANPNIRFLDVKNTVAFRPLTDIESPGWRQVGPDQATQMSAVGYFFAKDLYARYQVPIGIIQSEVGGTFAEAWMSAEALKSLPDHKAAAEKVELLPMTAQAAELEYQQQLVAWAQALNQLDRGQGKGGKGWHRETLSKKRWGQMVLPTLWEEAGLPGLDGVVWFRKEIMVTRNAAGQDAVLRLSRVDDADSTWFNGVKVGQGEGYTRAREYRVPGRLVKAGRNTVAVRVEDSGGGGGMWGIAEDMEFVSGDTRIPLAGEWAYQVGVDFKVLPRPNNPVIPNTATVLYNGMIAPLMPFAIRGVIWYQGESNAASAFQYRTLFPTLIRDWRTHWGQGDFPFLFVQLANFMKPATAPGESAWAELREAQLMALSVPRTGMAVIIDIGEAADIHPKNKLDVGKRLALAARKVAYQEPKITFSGPVYERMQIEGNQVRLSFQHTGQGLTIQNGTALKGFAVAGPDKKFHWAEATLDGNTVLVKSAQVPNPVAVRYGWADNPEGINLYNQEGLPAAPFRTDQWPGLTQGKK